MLRVCRDLPSPLRCRLFLVCILRQATILTQGRKGVREKLTLDWMRQKVPKAAEIRFVRSFPPSFLPPFLPSFLPPFLPPPPPSPPSSLRLSICTFVPPPPPALFLIISFLQ